MVEAEGSGRVVVLVVVLIADLETLLRITGCNTVGIDA
jgi:hypothetical protein